MRASHKSFAVRDCILTLKCILKSTTLLASESTWPIPNIIYKLEMIREMVVKGSRLLGNFWRAIYYSDSGMFAMERIWFRYLSGFWVTQNIEGFQELVNLNRACCRNFKPKIVINEYDSRVVTKKWGDKKETWFLQLWYSIVWFQTSLWKGQESPTLKLVPNSYHSGLTMSWQNKYPDSWLENQGNL